MTGKSASGVTVMNKLNDGQWHHIDIDRDNMVKTLSRMHLLLFFFLFSVNIAADTCVKIFSILVKEDVILAFYFLILRKDLRNMPFHQAPPP